MREIRPHSCVLIRVMRPACRVAWDFCSQVFQLARPSESSEPSSHARECDVWVGKGLDDFTFILDRRASLTAKLGSAVIFIIGGRMFHSSAKLVNLATGGCMFHSNADLVWHRSATAGNDLSLATGDPPGTVAQCREVPFPDSRKSAAKCPSFPHLKHFALRPPAGGRLDLPRPNGFGEVSEGVFAQADPQC